MKMSSQGWFMVDQEHPCPVCGHTRWCLIAPSGRGVLCQRIETKQARAKQRNFHIVRPNFDLAGMECFYRRDSYNDPKYFVYHNAQLILDMDLSILARESRRLGVSAASLRKLGMGYEKRLECITFPMREPKGDICGIRRRFPNGDKRSFAGSKNGLFLPMEMPKNVAYVLIVEGPTDAAAGLDMGFYTIGIPSALGRLDWAVEQILHIQRDCNNPDCIPVIVADRDPVGMKSACRLRKMLAAACKTCALILPPRSKDLREWLNRGATRHNVCRVITRALEKNPTP